MAHAASELETVSPHSALWRTFDPSIKTELFSTALNTPEATWLIDPIPLSPTALTQLNARPPVQGVIVTNQNHWRASRNLAEQFSVPIFAHPEAKADDAPSFRSLTDGQQLGDFLDVITIEGAAPGEIALVARVGRSAIVVGDALINFEPYGFTFLPRKYCANYGKMRQSLKRLAEIDVEQIFFAHGMPILSNGARRVKTLLDEI